jgi:hypothetical protein
MKHKKGHRKQGEKIDKALEEDDDELEEDGDESDS